MASKRKYSVKVGVTSKPKEVYTANLRKWLSKPLEFEYITHAHFSSDMRLATIAFDKDHTIYVLVPSSIFSPETGWDKFK